MKQQLTNTQVERFLSLTVILYGIYCIGKDLRTIISFLLRSVNQIDFGLLQIIVSSLELVFYCAVIFFCRPIIRQIAYYATREKRRSRRVWNAQDLAAIPLIFYAAWQILGLAFSTIIVLPIILWNHHASPIGMELFIQMLILVFSILVSFTFAVVILFFARSIAGWLLRQIDGRIDERIESQADA